MEKGLVHESSKIWEIRRVLRGEGLSTAEVDYYMNVDEDFIPDVLQVYAWRQRGRGRVFPLPFLYYVICKIKKNGGPRQL